jgi:crotonobetainyl-CoA:carnitine CoA-transferase CaiB-like acyl-CoA transferase
VAAIIAGETADHWRPLFAKADCCATIVASLEEALADAHFRARGLFDRQVTGATGAAMAALPVPIAAIFRDEAAGKPAPPLGGAELALSDSL